MILSGQSIRERGDLVEPFCERTECMGLTYGLANAGYDIRIAQTLSIPPGGIVTLASSMEYFKMPLDLAARVMDKSTWARRGLFVQNTFIDPGWCGWLTLELTNNSLEVIELVEGMPIAQIIFEMLDKPTEPYTGKYQDQENRPVKARG